MENLKSKFESDDSESESDDDDDESDDESASCKCDKRIQSLEERVSYLESIIKGFHKETNVSFHDFDDIKSTLIINKDHLTKVLETNMEEQILCMIINENKKRPFMKMTKHLCMYKNGWVYMEDSDLKLLIETIEHKLLLLHSKSSYDPEKCFENNKIIYGLNLSVRFKKIKNKLIDTL